MPVENDHRGERPDLELLSTVETDQGSTTEPENDPRKPLLRRAASGSVPILRALAWLLLKLSFVAAPVIAFYLMSVLPADGFTTLGLPSQLAEVLTFIGGLVVFVCIVGWALLTYSYLFSLDPERDFDWYAEHVGFFVFGLYACAFAPAVVSLLPSAFSVLAAGSP